ncbi:MAG: hypothetical protein ACP5JJ_09745, partial [Anaerolineae bacterium]
MTKRALHWLPVMFVVVLLVVLVVALSLIATLSPAVQAQDTPPPMLYEINGIYYGDAYAQAAYQIPYHVVGYSPPITDGTRTRATLYQHLDENGWLYFAMVVDRSVNDNVYVPSGENDPYLRDAGWNPNAAHRFDQLEGSDHLQFQFECGQASYTWHQDYLYNSGGIWLSDVYGPDGEGTTPPTTVSSSSLVWNVTNSTWPLSTTHSPNTGDMSKVTDEIGYPPLSTQPDDNINYNTTYQWEWPMVYEFAIHYPTVCGGAPIEPFDMMVIGAHNSPAKDDVEDVPLAVDLLYFTAEGAKKSVVLSWATTSEVDNLGFNLWRAESIDGERVKINEELIPSN